MVFLNHHSSLFGSFSVARFAGGAHAELAVVGVPEMTPVVALMVKGFGRAPLETVKVYGAVPPTAETVWL